MKKNTVAVGVMPGQLSDRRCPAGNHLLGAEPFWCLTCNDYANDLLLAEAEAEEQRGALDGAAREPSNFLVRERAR